MDLRAVALCPVPLYPAGELLVDDKDRLHAEGFAEFQRASVVDTRALAAAMYFPELPSPRPASWSSMP
jgi:hypothetical protein